MGYASIIAAALAVGTFGQAPQPSAATQPDLSVSSKDTGDNIYEVTVSGRQFTSRDAVEGRLLRDTAQLTLRKGHEWFALLPMPREPNRQNPLRPVPTYGVKYVGWHAQWTYKLEGERWQPWRPEWGSPFWADSIDRSRLIAFEASALVQMGSGPAPEEREPLDAQAVLRDVRL